jgi:hypothetical protein
MSLKAVWPGLLSCRRAVAAVAVLAGVLASPLAQGADCGVLRTHNFSAAVEDRVVVHLAEDVAPSSDLPGYCRLTATVAPAVNIEIRMPRDGWTGRLLVNGCGGLCGTVEMRRTDDALARGYAVATTDMGHAVAEGVSWYDDAAKVEDWAHRSTHVTALLTKAAVAAYYGRRHLAAYFRGCSTGGRQGLASAVTYPLDFDGIIAGAPAAAMAIPTTIWQARANVAADGSSILDGDAFAVLHNHVLGRCDAADGLRDGIVSDPLSCDPRPEELACKPGQSGACLSAAQVQAAQLIYQGPRTSKGEAIASMGVAPGTEMQLVARLARPKGELSSAETTAGTVIRRDLGDDADLADYDFDVEVFKPNLTSNLPELGPKGTPIAPFQKRGGKLLLYSGWADPFITPAVALDYYRHQAAALGGPEAAASFLRLFMIPGMAHCGGGNGPDAIDFLSAIEAWVETGVAPERLIAIKPMYTFDPGENREVRFPMQPRDIAFRRPIFPFPAYTRYKGTGTLAVPESFEPAFGTAR